MCQAQELRSLLIYCRSFILSTLSRGIFPVCGWYRNAVKQSCRYYHNFFSFMLEGRHLQTLEDTNLSVGKMGRFQCQSWCWILEKAQLQGFFFILINCCVLNVGGFLFIVLEGRSGVWAGFISFCPLFLYFINLKDNDGTWIMTN